MIEDAVLIRLYKNGASDVFDVIYGYYYKPVYGYIYRMVKDKALADDLTQETFIKVLGGLKDVDENKGLSSWIFRIAHNTCVDYYRKNRVCIELMDNSTCCDSEASCPEDIYLNKEKYQKIREVLFMINQKYRAVLLLRVSQNLSYREIAAQLKLKESAVKTLIHRGRQQFQKIYAEAY